MSKSTDLEQFKALLEGLRLEYQSGPSIVDWRFWRPEDLRPYERAEGDTWKDTRRKADERWARERKDTRKSYWVSVGSAHFIFDSDGVCKGVMSDERGDYVPSTTRDGYWPAPEV